MIARIPLRVAAASVFRPVARSNHLWTHSIIKIGLTGRDGV